MIDNTKTVYKVVYDESHILLKTELHEGEPPRLNDPRDFYSTSASVYSPWTVKYRIGRKSKPRFQYSPLMAFDSLMHAFIECSPQATILKCKAVLFPIAHPIWKMNHLVLPHIIYQISNRDKQKSFTEFWKLVSEDMIHTALYEYSTNLGDFMTVPVGTVFCESIVPLYIVSKERITRR